MEFHIPINVLVFFFLLVHFRVNVCVNDFAHNFLLPSLLLTWSVSQIEIVLWLEQ